MADNISESCAIVVSYVCTWHSHGWTDCRTFVGSIGVTFAVSYVCSRQSDDNVLISTDNVPDQSTSCCFSILGSSVKFRANDNVNRETKLMLS